MSYYKTLQKYVQNLPKLAKRLDEQHQREEIIRLRRELESQPISCEEKIILGDLKEMCSVLNKLDTLIQLNKESPMTRKFYWSVRLNLMTHYYSRLSPITNTLFDGSSKGNLYKQYMEGETILSTMHYWRKLSYILRNPALDSKRIYEHYVRLFKSYGPESACRLYRYICFIVDHYDKTSTNCLLSNLTIYTLNRVILTMDKYYRDEYRFIQTKNNTTVTYIDNLTNVSQEAVCRSMSFDLNMPRTKAEAIKLKEEAKQKQKKGKQADKGKLKGKFNKPNKPNNKPNKPSKPKKVIPAFLGNYELRDKPPIGTLSLKPKTKEVKVVVKKSRKLTQEQLDALRKDIKTAKETIQ